MRRTTRATFGHRAFEFYAGLVTPRVPRGVSVMNPYAGAEVQRYLRMFLDTYFGDNDSRVLVLGINPGRFGAGITGITFTDPVVLEDACGIDNHFPRRRELSSIFFYDFIDRMGGPAAFYRRFFLSAVSPLGFLRGGTNLNYYDEAPLARAVTPFIATSIQRQIALGGRRDRAIVLGMGQNQRFLQDLNREHGFFREIHALEHPRWIMQYRRKRVGEYLEKYERVFEAVAGRQ